ncbi:MAG: RraA family protein [Opitutaceae bacterium]
MSSIPSDDAGLFELMRQELFTAVVGDVLDAAGCTRQFLPPDIRALRADMVVAGRAMTVLEADCCGDDVAAERIRRPFGLMFRALDDLKPGEVYLCTGASFEYALWGELMSTRAHHCGAAGAVVNGFSRDTRGILRMEFPVFSRGTYAQDQRMRGRVIDFRCPLAFPNGVRVSSGDVLFGDIDGVLVIPHRVLRDTVAAALKKVRGENKVAAAIRAGLSTQEAWDKFGIM